MLITPFQTVGPFFHFALAASDAHRIAGEKTRGHRITIEGVVLDGRTQPVADALVEVWQADADGHYRHAADGRSHAAADDFRGFGRCATDESGRFSFATIKPGQVPGPSSPQAPHLVVGLLSRGVMTRLVTRMYFADEAGPNAEDPILRRVPASRRQTLVARQLDAGRYHFAIVLQGERETVFFDV